MKVAIQGIAGSYHHQAAVEFFQSERFDLLCIDSFSKVAQSLTTREADYGIMAIENSIAGTILPNYNLITKNQLKIIGEIYLPIHHQFIAHPAAEKDRIVEVRSHPMALLQCADFLEAQPHMKILECADTASAARQIAEEGLVDVAAIASRMSAEIYGLKILESDVQNIYKNSTRFFVLSRASNFILNFNKVSMKFSTSHQTGALSAVLSEVSKLGINLKKLQSVPIVDEPWQYAFHVDLELSAPAELDLLVEKLAAQTLHLEILGKYQNAVDPIVNPQAYPAVLEPIYS